MKVTIAGQIFKLQDTIYLVQAGKKFWQGRVQNNSLLQRVGVIADGQEKKDSEVQSKKVYGSKKDAENSLVDKIEDKIAKGYVREVPKKAQPVGRTRSRNRLNQVQQFSGSLLEKGNESVAYEVLDNFLKVTSTKKGAKGVVKIEQFKEDIEAKKQAVKCVNEKKKQGFVQNKDDFVFTFTEDDLPKKSKGKTDYLKVPGASSKKGSLVGMTDKVMSDDSRSDDSPARSARSADPYTDLKDTDLGKPCSGPKPVLLAKVWEDEVDPKGMYISQKLDGVRMFWTGTQMYSRNGNKFAFPDFFTKGWPKCQLDGQLWIGRGKFHQCLSAIKKNNPIDDQWKKVTFLVFDAPGLDKPFDQRIKAIQNTLAKIGSPYLRCHYHRICEGVEDLLQELDQVNKNKGEGLMLRNPRSYYEGKRSNNLLKVKTFHDDEAEVIGYQAGEGRCLGMVGALKMRNRKGVQFEIGSGLNDDLRRRPPKVGSWVTFKYQELNEKSGKPRFPVYLRPYVPL